MKSLFISLLLIVIISLQLSAQLPTNEKGQIEFSEVVQVEGISKDDLFNNAVRWFAEAFKDAKEVIQLKDKESGEVFGKGNFDFSNVALAFSCYSGEITFTIQVLVKDGRYKVIMSDFIHKAVSNSQCDFGYISNGEFCTSNQGQQTKWKVNICSDIKNDIQSTVNTLLASLKIAMNNTTAIDDNW